MNQTSNYQLSQWDQEDRILRADFNSDNAKIDGALAEKLGTVEFISETILEETTTTMNVDLTSIDWNQWSFVIVSVAKFNAGENIGFTELYVSGVDMSVSSKLSGSITPVAGIRMAVLFPLRDAQREACAVFFPGGGLSRSAQPFSNITGMTLYSNVGNTILNGTTIRVYGIR